MHGTIRPRELFPKKGPSSNAAGGQNGDTTASFEQLIGESQQDLDASLGAPTFRELREVLGSMDPNRMRNLGLALVTARKRETLSEQDFEKWMTT